MSAPDVPPPVQRRYSGGQIFLIAIGSILLLPGLCSLLVILTMIPDFVGGFYSGVKEFAAAWFITFCVSAGGIVLINEVRKGAGRPS